MDKGASSGLGSRATHGAGEAVSTLPSFDPSRGPLIAHYVRRSNWQKAATEIAETVHRYPARDAAFRAAMAAFEATDPDAVAVESIIKSLWDDPSWSLETVALACFKAGRQAAIAMEAAKPARPERARPKATARARQGIAQGRDA
jgi:hypothetical protein